MLQNNKHSQIARDILNKHDLNLSSNFITRENMSHGTSIDIIATNRPEEIKCFPLINELISDHETLIIQTIVPNKIALPPVNIISWQNYNKDKLLNNLRDKNWHHFTNLNINEKITLLRQNIMSAVNPLIKQIQIKNNIKPKPWFDYELKNLKNEKISAYLTWLNDKSQLKWLQYTKIRNKYINLLNDKR